MFIKHSIALLLICASGLPLLSQTITPQVINAAGDFKLRSDGVSLLDNVGEPFTQSIAGGESLITQGFIQNYNYFSILKSDETCIGKKNGQISVLLNKIDYPVSEIKYIWLPPGTCPLDTCSKVIKNLKPQTYTVSIVITAAASGASNSITAAPITIQPSTDECLVKVYNAVTVNNDFINEVFIIENIKEFPNNKVSIYNRWGTLVFESIKYDNEKIYWPNKENLNTLASSTYFYIIDLGDGSALLKGWVELFIN